eukprot:363565-Chlamydomonas_euryale.AAC.17
MDVDISLYRVDVTPPPLTVLTACRTAPQYKTYHTCCVTLHMCTSMGPTGSTLPMGFEGFRVKGCGVG